MNPWLLVAWVGAIALCVVIVALAIVVVIAMVQGLRPKEDRTVPVMRGRADS